MTLSTESIAQWRGADVIDSSGDKVGKVEEIYLDQETDLPEWALVKTGLFSGKGTFVPLADASPDGDRLRVPYEKDQIKDAPSIDPDQELSQQEEQDLYSHYGMSYSQEESGSGLPAGAGPQPGGGDEPGGPGGDTGGPSSEQAPTPSEEELHAGTTSEEAGRVRLKKYVAADQSTQAVAVQPDDSADDREEVGEERVDVDESAR